MTDATGAEIRGRIARISADAVTLSLPGGDVTIEERRVREVQRIGDPLWNGAAVPPSASKTHVSVSPVFGGTSRGVTMSVRF